MDHYVDIRLLPDPEFPAPLLMNALFAKLHRALVDHGGRDIGVSFPDVIQSKRTLGQRLRLHGNSASLDRLMAIGWLQGMRDHVTVTSAQSVPAEVQHCVVRRVQAKSSPERLRRRLAARKSIDAETAQKAIPDSAAEMLELPYVEIASRSTGQRFKLFVEHLKPVPTATAGSFGTYGLGTSATVPWF